MRREEREITDAARLNAVIEACDCCRLGFSDGDEVYIVPMNFAYDPDARVFYFHGAAEGRKIECIRKTGKAGFELDTAHALARADAACSHSFFYASVIGTGRVSLVCDGEEKARALSLIMRHYTGREGWAFSGSMTKGVAVIRLDVEHMSGKEHRNAFERDGIEKGARKK